MSTIRLRDLRPFRVLGAALLCAAAACGGDGPTSAVPADEVRVSNNQFTPANRTVMLGSTVTFRWASGSVTHNVTFNDGPASPNRSSGTYARQFDLAGSYPYQCTLHTGMTGTITVQPVVALR